MLQTAQKQRAPCDQRTQQIKYLAEVEAECESFSAQLGVSATLDPSTVSENLHLVRLARSAAVGHTENVGILMKFASHWLQVEPDAAVRKRKRKRKRKRDHLWKPLYALTDVSECSCYSATSLSFRMTGKKLRTCLRHSRRRRSRQHLTELKLPPCQFSLHRGSGAAGGPSLMALTRNTDKKEDIGTARQQKG